MHAMFVQQACFFNFKHLNNNWDDIWNRFTIDMTSGKIVASKMLYNRKRK